MTNRILLSASFLAILAAFPAFAAETNTKADVSAGAKIESTLDNAGEKISNTADKAAAKTEAAYEATKAKSKEAYSDVKAYFSDDDDVAIVSDFNMGARLEAGDLIGATIQNPKGEEIGTIEDILVNAEGDAQTVIVNDKGVLGLGGKLAAFDADIMEGFNKDNEVIAKLTEASLKNAKAFDFEANGNKLGGIPTGQFSVKKILDSKVVDANGKAVADVDTVVFEDDDADYVIVTFNKILGIGGDKAALNFEALNLAEANGKYSFKLNSQQTAQFESNKEAQKAN